MGFVEDFTEVERVERQAPPPHPSPLKGEGVGGGVGPAAASDRDSAADWVRQNLPETAAFAAAVRAEFPQTRLLWASENGHEIGRKPEPAAFVVSGEALIFRPIKAGKGRS